MKIPFVDLAKQHEKLEQEIHKKIKNVIKNSDFIRGSHMAPFEKQFSKLIGTKHCISCANGTDAIYIALKAQESVQAMKLSQHLILGFHLKRLLRQGQK